MTGLQSTVQITIFVAAAVSTTILLIGSSHILFLAIVGVCTKPRPTASRAPKARFLVLIPAHDEENGILPTLTSLRQLAYPSDLFRVVVIADNCSDNTADVVGRSGHECWIRTAPDSRGKGQALQWALSRAAYLEYDAVAIVDADTIVESNFLSTLNDAIAEGAQVMQVRDDYGTIEGRSCDHSALSALGKDAETALFWRPRQRLGLVVNLQGPGCAFTRDTLQKVSWSAHSIVEDLEFSFELAIKRIRVTFLEHSSVVARSTSSVSDALPQRIRWASGTFRVLARCVPRLLLASVRQKSFYLAEAVIAETFISRVFLLHLLVISTLLSCLVTWHWAVLFLRTMLGASVFFLLVYAALLPCALRQRSSRKWYTFLLLPLYVAWVVVVQCLALIHVRRNVWARSVR